MSSPPAHRARKRFGQNFLHDATIVERIVAAVLADSRQGNNAASHFVEIGPGMGALTRPLINELANKDDWRVTLIELDRDLAGRLNHELRNLDNLEILQTDALKLNFSELANDAFPTLQLFGNLPYNISTPLIFHLLDCNEHYQKLTGRPLFCSMIFMLQKEVVDRLCAQAGSKAYGRISVMTQYHCQMEALFDVPPSAFQPQPKVTSAMIRLRPHQQKPSPAKDEALLSKIVQQAFAQRRKTLRNNLSPLINLDKLTALGIDPSRRAETLSLSEYVAISNSLMDQTDN